MSVDPAQIPESLLANAIDAAEIGVIIVNAAGEIVVFNDWVSRASGISADRARGEQVEAVFPEIAESRISAGIDSALQRGLSVVLSPYFAKRSFPLRATSSTHQGEAAAEMQQKVSIKPIVFDGKVVQCIVQIQDMSDAMRRESLLRDQAVNNKRMMSQHMINEERIRAILDGAFDGIITLDKDHRIESFNPAASQIFGYRADEILGCGIEQIIPGLLPTEDVEKSDILERLRVGEGIILQAAGLHRNHREFVAEVALKSMQAGDELKIVAMVRDISERKAMEQDLKDFVYVVSHDLQSPLHTVLSFAKRLRKATEGKLDDKGEKSIGYVIGGAERMVDLIRDLAEYSRIETRGRVLEPTRLGDHVEAALENLRSGIEESRAELIVEDMPVVLGDSTQLIQLVQNLVANALKFCSDSQPKVRLAAQSMGDLWKISVEDNGIGIREEFQQRIFQVFQRLHTQDEYPGTGIGLSLCKKIVERHGGRIWLESEPGQGTTFHFTLQGSELEKNTDS